MLTPAACVRFFSPVSPSLQVDIVSAGDFVSELHLLLAGHAAAERGNAADTQLASDGTTSVHGASLRLLGPGEPAGEMAFFTETPSMEVGGGGGAMHYMLSVDWSGLVFYCCCCCCWWLLKRAEGVQPPHPAPLACLVHAATAAAGAANHTFSCRLPPAIHAVRAHHWVVPCAGHPSQRVQRAGSRLPHERTRSHGQPAGARRAGRGAWEALEDSIGARPAENTCTA